MGTSGLAVFSDSDLLVRFLTRRARPRDGTLVPLVKEIKELASREMGTRVEFYWVPREENEWADWLSH